MAEQVPAIRTPLAPSQALELITSALQAELGREPTAAEIKILLAQTALETDRWQKMYNWNFGNSVASSGAPFFTLREASVHHYRPFSSAWQGVTYFVALIRRRFAQAWSLLGSGDPLAYAYALKAQNYYEAPADQYGAAMAALYREFGSSSVVYGPAVYVSLPGRSPDPSAKGRNSPATAGFGGGALLFLAWYWFERRQLRY